MADSLDFGIDGRAVLGWLAENMDHPANRNEVAAGAGRHPVLALGVLRDLAGRDLVKRVDFGMTPGGWWRITPAGERALRESRQARRWSVGAMASGSPVPMVMGIDARGPEEAVRAWMETTTAAGYLSGTCLPHVRVRCERRSDGAAWIVPLIREWRVGQAERIEEREVDHG